MLTLFNTLGPKAKWPIFHIRHFIIHFLVCHIWHSYVCANVNERCHQVSMEQLASTGFTPNRQQAIHRSNDSLIYLTHWGRVTHICVGKLTIIGSDNGLSPKRHQAIIWTNAGILLIGPLGTKFSEILSEIHTFSFKKCIWRHRAKWRPFCLGLNVLTIYIGPHREKIKHTIMLSCGVGYFAVTSWYKTICIY